MTRLDGYAAAAQAHLVSEMVKFSSKLDEAALEELRSYAKESGRPIASLLTEAVQQYLARVRVRPAFRSAVDEVLDEHDELLARLAR